VTVTATDNVNPNPQFATATVFVNVLRDRFSPVFSNLPTVISVQESVGINASVFTATATDQDLKGSIVYQMIGMFPAQSFFDVNPSTGRVFLRNGLLSDSLQTSSYVVSCELINPYLRTDFMMLEILGP
jgi:protocadherin Fat 4